MNITEIKQRLTITQVLSHYNQKPDNNNRLRCPWHDDKTPSLQIYPKTGTWTCFSANCEAGSGDVIDYVMKYENISKYQAIQKCIALIRGTPLEQEQSAMSAATGKSTEKAPLLGRVAALNKAFTYFKSGIMSGNSPQLKQYLDSRGLDKNKLEMGFNSGQFHFRENKQYTQSYLQTGLLSKDKNGGHNIFAKHCIIFPLKDNKGQYVSLYGRSIYDNSSSRHYYLKNTQGLYPYYPPAHTKKLIIPESIIDTATLVQTKAEEQKLKKYELLAAYGTNRLSEEHLEAITALEDLEEIILFFDGDDAGRKAVQKYSEKLHLLLPRVRISHVNTPDGEDVNSMYVNYGEEALHTLLHERETLYHPSEAENTSATPEHVPFGTPKFNGNNHEALTYQTNELYITVLGGIKISGLERMKTTLKIEVKTSHYAPLRQHLDLYNNEQLTRLIRTINEQMDIKTDTVRQALLGLVEELEHYRINRISRLQPSQPKTPELSPRELTHAETYLKSPDLMANTMEDLGRTGIVGEDYNRIIMYLVFLSRVTDEPLHIISFGASGTGKTHLQEKIGMLLPETDKTEITTLSGNALYYLQHDEISHKVLLIEDMHGAQEVLYPLRELQTKQKITKKVSLKDSQGNMKTFTFTVRGPVCIAGCTTQNRIYEDNANRSILIYTDSSREQDERIMEYQRKESAGKIDKAKQEQYQCLLRHVQQVIKPIKIINPYAPYLQIPPGVFKKRRSNWIYLRFIEAITLYHQYQREQKTNTTTGDTYIETTLDDIAWANKLLKGILLRKADELSEPARSFFERLKGWLKEKNTAHPPAGTSVQSGFKTRDIRDNLQTTTSSLKRYLPELLNCGHIKITGGNKTRGYTYEVTSYEEYQKLKHSIDHLLDSLLDKLKRKHHAEDKK